MIINEIKELKGKTFVDIIVKKYDFFDGENEIIFKCETGEVYRMYHEQECCENVYIEDIIGDIKSLIGYPLVMAEEITREGKEDDDGTSTWTFYKFATVKGYVTIRWYGFSNGYYSESVDIEEITQEYKKELKPYEVAKRCVGKLEDMLKKTHKETLLEGKKELLKEKDIKRW